jgi:hypothetical protein
MVTLVPHFNAVHEGPVEFFLVMEGDGGIDEEVGEVLEVYQLIVLSIIAGEYIVDFGNS